MTILKMPLILPVKCLIMNGGCIAFITTHAFVRTTLISRRLIAGTYYTCYLFQVDEKLHIECLNAFMEMIDMLERSLELTSQIGMLFDDTCILKTDFGLTLIELLNGEFEMQYAIFLDGFECHNR